MTDALPAFPPAGSERGEQILLRLQQLLVQADGLQDFLQELVRLAATALPAPVFCSITLTTENRSHPYTAAASDELVDRFDQRQYEAGEGPCLETLRTGRLHRIDDIRETDGFGSFPKLALENSLRSVLALPLAPPRQRTAGVLNMYSIEPGAFTPAVREQAAVFAGHASGALGVALKFAGQTQFSTDLQNAIASRTVIDQALGIVMARESCGAERAFEILARASQNRNVKLRELAAEIVTRVGGEPPSVRPLGRRSSPLSGAEKPGFHPPGQG